MGSSTASESKSFASLGPMLLARKGTAKPAMRVQLEQSDRMATLRDDLDELAHSQSDLGWNDMGGSVHLISSNPANDQRRKAPAARKARGSGERAAFTLRLDAERHFKLRLASTIQDASAQALVTEALDRFLDEIPELDAIARQVHGKNDKA